MIEVKAPAPYAQHKGMTSVFLAGTIDMGNSVDWQQQIAEALRDKNVLLLNPRRAQWDASWEQSIDNPQFCEQVEWELNALDAANIIVIYFATTSKSPITMMELGIHAAKNPQKLIVCCCDGFWRKGNVDIVCKRYGVKQVKNIDELVAAIKAL